MKLENEVWGEGLAILAGALLYRLTVKVFDTTRPKR